MTHLAPFVEVSRQKFRKNVIAELDEAIEAGDIEMTKDSERYKRYVNRIVESRVREEIKRGVQMIQYQVITLMTTNGKHNCLAVVKAG